MTERKGFEDWKPMNGNNRRQMNRIRFVLSLALTSALVISLVSLLTLLNDPNPNAALTALLGTITGSLGTGLVALIGAVAGKEAS